jgi:hypothetical protein
VRAQSGEAFNGGVAAALSPQLAANAASINAAVAASATALAACAKIQNGQLRLADAQGCNPSEVAVTLSAGNVTPLEVTRLLTIPASAANQFNGIFGGLLCPPDRTLVSGGFQLLRTDLRITDSFVGPAFNLPRVYFAQVLSTNLNVLPAGDMTRMWATCL